MKRERACARARETEREGGALTYLPGGGDVACAELVFHLGYFEGDEGEGRELDHIEKERPPELVRPVRLPLELEGGDEGWLLENVHVLLLL